MTTDTDHFPLADLVRDVTTHSATVIDDLVDAGASTIGPASGHTLHLTLTEEPDHDVTLEDYDCYGQIEWINTFGGRSERPHHFDGNAEKVDAPQHGVFWWQPPKDGPPRTDPGFRELRGMVRDLVVFGFHVLFLTATHRTPDGYARTWSTAIGGIEPFPDRDHRVSLVDDLLSELTDSMED